MLLNIKKKEKIFCYIVDYATPSYEGYMVNDMALKGYCGELSDEGEKLITDAVLKNTSLYSNNVENCNVAPKFMLRYVNAYGLAESAAYAICDKIIHLTNIFSTSARQAAGGMVGQNIGAKKPDRVVVIVRCCAIVTLTAAAVLAAAGILFPRAFFSLFDSNPDVLAYARPFMLITGLIYFLGATMAPFEAVVSGTGHSMLGFLGGILDGVVFRIGFSFLFAFALNMGVTGFLLGDALARLGPIIVSGSYYLSGAWRRRKRLVSDSD